MSFSRALSLIFLITAETSFASPTPIIDLRPEMGPIRNQSNKGWCYANAAADLLSFRFLDRLKKESASAIYTALSYINKYLEEGNGITDGGYDYQAILAAKDMGLCPRGFDDQLLWSGFNIGDLKKKLEFVGELYDQKSKIIRLRKLGRSDRDLENAYESSILKLKSSSSILAPLIKRSTNEQITHFVERTSREDFYFELAKLICKEAKIQIEPGYTVTNTQFLTGAQKLDIQRLPFGGFITTLSPDADALRLRHTRRKYTYGKREPYDDRYWGLAMNHPTDLVDFYLQKNKPVSISYYSAFLKLDFLSKTFVKDYARTLRSGSHASVIVAVREVPVTGKREYLIRNSWGESCASYSPALRDSHCEKGHIWVPSDVLNVFVNQVTAID